jgi:hypothetical protein
MFWYLRFEMIIALNINTQITINSYYKAMKGVALPVNFVIFLAGNHQTKKE